MSESELKVSVVRYPDRKNLVLRWEDPETGRQLNRSAGTHVRSKAERKARDLERELEAGLYNDNKISWADFRDRYENECLSALSDGTFTVTQATLNMVEKILQPVRLSHINESRISTFQTELRKQGRSEATIARHSRHLKHLLNWAVRKKLLRFRPSIDMPKGGKSNGDAMKGRAIVAEEYERMLAVVPKVVGKRHVAGWRFLLEGLWWSGLRIGEALELVWDVRADKFHVELDGRRPMFWIPKGFDKSKKARLLPMAPEFAQTLAETQEVYRSGLVFRPTLEGHRSPLRRDRCSKVIGDIGEKAGVIVEETRYQGHPHTKYASAHDLRRSFGTRWAGRVLPQVLKEMMRHASITTTEKYYITQRAEMTADSIWKAYDGTVFELGNISGNSESQEREAANA